MDVLPASGAKPSPRTSSRTEAPRPASDGNTAEMFSKCVKTRFVGDMACPAPIIIRDTKCGPAVLLPTSH
eukprot:1421755-Rhodomonas_salina.2